MLRLSFHLMPFALPLATIASVLPLMAPAILDSLTRLADPVPIASR
jgi:hypothetical protein